MKVKTAILVTYIVLLMLITLVFFRGNPYAPIELDPIASYRRAANASPYLARIEIRNAALNVAMFIPLGFLPPMLWDELKKPIRLISLALAFTFTIEVAQLVFSRGVFAVEDILHNTMGAAIGLLVCKIWQRMTNK